MGSIQHSQAFRRKAVIRELAENGGSMRKAMVKAGYSIEYADNPKKLTKSKTWIELLEHYLPDKKLAQVTNEGLRANLPHDDTPDYNVRHKYLETSLKVKGKLINSTDITSNGQPIGGFVVVRTAKPIENPVIDESNNNKE